MDSIDNDMRVYINMLSAVVSYPLFNNIYDLTGDLESLYVILEELDQLLDNGDIGMAFLLFQYLMGIAEMEIPPEIRSLSNDASAMNCFMCELSMDLEDYYTQELAELELELEDNEDDAITRLTGLD